MRHSLSLYCQRHCPSTERLIHSGYEVSHVQKYYNDTAAFLMMAAILFVISQVFKRDRITKRKWLNCISYANNCKPWCDDGKAQDVFEELSDKVGLTLSNLSILRQEKQRLLDLAHWKQFVVYWIVRRHFRIYNDEENTTIRWSISLIADFAASSLSVFWRIFIFN
jgi:hypothetical protein